MIEDRIIKNGKVFHYVDYAYVEEGVSNVVYMADDGERHIVRRLVNHLCLGKMDRRSLEGQTNSFSLAFERVMDAAMTDEGNVEKFVHQSAHSIQKIREWLERKQTSDVEGVLDKTINEVVDKVVFKLIDKKGKDAVMTALRKVSYCLDSEIIPNLNNSIDLQINKVKNFEEEQEKID